MPLTYSMRALIYNVCAPIIQYISHSEGAPSYSLGLIVSVLSYSAYIPYNPYQ